MSFAVLSCSTNPMTGRRSLQLMGNQEITSMSFTNYKQVLNKSKVIHATKEAIQMKNVGNKNSQCCTTILQKYRARKRFKWLCMGNSTSLKTNRQMLGACLGVKLPYIQVSYLSQKNDTGLAVVMGHEVAQCPSQDMATKRISQSMIAQLWRCNLRKFYLEPKMGKCISIYISTDLASRITKIQPKPRIRS